MSTRNRPNRAKVRSASGPIALKTSKEIARRPAMLLVLGMHRSGTSVCARILECLGAKPSANLMPPVPDNNEKGFFEDMDVYRFNESQLLPRLQRSWHSTAPVDWSCLNDGDRSRLAMEAVQIIRRNFSASEPLSILKEPRLAMLLPFWISVLTHAGYDIRIVCALRDPVSVARSLGRRDRLSTTHSGLLFTSYWLAILSCIKHLPVAFVQFDEIFTEPRRCLEKVAKHLGLETPADFRLRVDEFLSDFLDKKLCHHEIHQQDLDLEPEMPGMALELYRALLRSAQSQSLAPALKHLQSAEKEFYFLQPILQEFDRTKQAFWREQAGVAEARQQITKLESERSGLLPAAQDRDAFKAKLAALQSERDNLAARISALESERSDLATRHSSLATALEELRGQHSSLATEREALLAARDALAQEKKQSAAQAAQLEQARQQIAAQRDQATKERDELKAKLEPLQSERDNLAARISALESERSDLATRHSSLATAFEQLQGQHSSLTREREALLAERDGLAQEKNRSGAQAEQFEQARQQIAAQRDALAKERDELKAKLDALQSERDGLNARLATLGSENSELVTRHSSLATAFEQLQGQHSSLTREREALLAERDGLAQEKNRSGAQAEQFEQARQQIAAQRDALAKERDELKAKLDALQSERDGLNARISALESEHSDLATRHKLLATEREALLAERDGLATKHAALEAERQLALERLDATSAELETITERRDDLEESLQQRFKESAELTKRLLSAEDALQDASQGREHLTAHTAALEAENSNLATERETLLAMHAELKSKLRRTEKALRCERHGSKEFSDDGWIVGPTSLGSSQHHPPYRHLNVYFAEVEGIRRRHGAVKFRLVEHGGHFGFCFFAAKGVSPALESWCSCGEEGGNSYMLVVPESKTGARLLAQLTPCDRSLVNTALVAAERAIRAKISTDKTEPLLTELWLPCALSLRESVRPKSFHWL